MTNHRFLNVVALLLIGPLLGVACDSTTKQSTSGSPGDLLPKGSQPRPAAKGGVMKLASVGDVDFMDPGQAYSVIFNGTIGRATLRTLVSYPGSPDMVKQVIPAPDLAIALGQDNAENTRWTYHLRPGLEYGKGLGGVDVAGVTGQPIQTSDIKYAIERLYNPAVGAGYPFYYDDIVGASRCKRAATYGCHIAGIKTPNHNTIVFNLIKPTGDWDMRMAMPATAPVPQRVASRYDRSRDSNYDSHVVSNGPYYIAKYVPGHTIVMKRNTTWDPASDPIRKAYAKKIFWKEGFDPNSCSEKVAKGQYDLTIDCSATGSELKRVSQLGKRFLDGPTPCTYYLFLNTTVKPLDKIKVRRAINFVIDKYKLRDRTPGGSLSGAIATSILPPGTVGHLGANYHPFLGLAEPTDVAQARALMRQAGYADGYRGKLRLFSSTGDSTSGQVESVRSGLVKIGIDNVDLRKPDPFSNPVYFQQPLPHTALGFASWCADFPSPDSFLTPLLYGPSIRSHANSNYSEVDDRALNSLILKAQVSDSATANAAWAAANKRATELAVWVPIRWSYARVVMSSRMRSAYYNQYLETVDFVNAGVKAR